MAKKDPVDPKKADLCAWCNSKLATRTDGLCGDCGRLSDDMNKKDK